MMDHPHNRQLQMEVMEYVRCELRPEEGWANVSHIRCSRSSRSQSLVFGVENDFYQVLNKTIIVNLTGVEYDSFVNYSDHDHDQAVSKAFHRAARDLPFMPLKFPAEGDFNNEEVDAWSPPAFLNLTSTIKVGNLGTVLHETSRLLAEQFDVEPSAVIAVSILSWCHVLMTLSAMLLTLYRWSGSPTQLGNLATLELRLFPGFWQDWHEWDWHHKLLPSQLET